MTVWVFSVKTSLTSVPRIALDMPTRSAESLALAVGNQLVLAARLLAWACFRVAFAASTSGLPANAAMTRSLSACDPKTFHQSPGISRPETNLCASAPRSPAGLVCSGTGASA